MIQKKKKGISLIVLIITIVVIIILATAIIVNIAKTNIIDNANEATNKNNEAQINEKVQLMIADYFIEKQNKVTLEAFLSAKKEKGEIEDFVNNGDGTYKVTLDGYYVIIDESNLNVTKAKKASDIEISYKIDGFENNKVKITVSIQSFGFGITEVKKPDGTSLNGNNEKSVSIPYEIEANKEYKFNIIASNGGTKEETISYEDDEAPSATISIAKEIIFGTGKQIEANVTISEDKSVTDIQNCKWVILQNNEKIGLDDSLYTGGNFNNNEEKITSEAITTAGDYYIHLLLKDKVGNAQEIVSKVISIKDGYEISTAEELQAMGDDLTADYYVTQDIDMAGFNFTTINGTFTGSIDGMGHTISNLTITNTSDYTAIFKTAESITVKNIIFKDVNISSDSRYVSVIAAEAKYSCNFEKVGITGAISGEGYIGSFIGYHRKGDTNTTNLINCYAQTTITSVSKYDSGGFVGYFPNNLSNPSMQHFLNISNCYAAFTINTTGRTGVFRGGYSISNNNNQLVGETTVTDSYYDSSLFTLSVPTTISGTPLSTDNMKKQSSYANWNFENTWYMGESGYPELKF